VGVPRYKKQPKMGDKGPSGPSKLPLDAVPYTAAGGMKPLTDTQKTLQGLKSFYENMIKPTGPGFDEKIAEMQAIKMPPFMAKSNNPIAAYGGKTATPFLGAAGKKAQLALEAIAASNWGSFFGAPEIMKTAEGKASPMDAINLGLTYAPFGLGKITKAGKSLLPSLKALKEILDTNK
jgi:hypothetical protein